MMNASTESHRGWRLCGVGLLALLSVPAAALAAPFCVSTRAVPPQCLYTDPGECQRDAVKQGGVCTVNTAEFKPPAGIGQYCLVTPSLVSMCIFPDRASCMADAKRRNGACVRSPTLAPFGAPDPYAAIGGK